MKTAIVTGASRGIGLATVKALLKSNYKVAGWSRSEIPLEESDSFIFCPTDITDEGSVDSSYKKSIDHFGRIDVLINNAGIGYEGTFEEISSSQWKKMFDVNVNGLFYSTRIVIPRMKEQASGHIINISSVAGNTGIPGMVGYCGTKYAVSGISNALMKEVRKSGIKVTCIHPGAVETNFFDEIGSVEANETMIHPSQIAETILHCLNAPENVHLVDLDIRPLSNKVSKP